MPKGVYPRRPMAERFWSRVRKGDGCWLWTGRRDGWGYGAFSVTHTQTGRAHRVAYELLVGPIPQGMELDHLCRIQACVRPDHLEPVTTRENQLRSNSPTGVNSRRTQCKRGHPFDAANTIVRTDGRRNCRACMAARSSEWVRANRVRARAQNLAGWHRRKARHTVGLVGA